LARPGEAPAAERGHQARQHERGLARPAVARDQQQRRLVKKRGQFVGLLLAAEEEVRLVAVVSLQADERIAREGELGTGFEPQHGPKQLLELVRLLGVSYALVLREETRQVRAGRARRQHRY